MTHSAIEDVRGLEERAFNAWPALSTTLADGWVMRLAAGYTKRANSLNAWAPACAISEILPHAAALYARAGLPLVVRLSPLAGDQADVDLDARNFRRIDETVVMQAPIGDFHQDPTVAISDHETDAWSIGFAGANNVPSQHRRTHDAILANIRLPTAFASLVQDGETLAWGLAVYERDKVGLFDIVTAPTARRRGIGRKLVTSLLAWGQAQGAASAYLQVVAANNPAIALYQDLGFAEAYRYHYRVAT